MAEEKKRKVGLYSVTESPLTAALQRAAHEAAEKKKAEQAVKTAAEEEAAAKKEKALRTFVEEGRSERPTLEGMPLVSWRPSETQRPTVAPAPKAPSPQQARRSASAYVPPAQLSPEEKKVLEDRFGRESVVYKGFTDPKQAGSGRQLVERVREEKGFVEKLEKHGFPKGLPDFTPFMAAFGPVSDRPMDFNTRRAYLRQFASMPSEDLRQFRNVGLAYILKMRFGEKAAKALALLPEKNKAEVLNAVREHEELRHELHGRGFPKEVPIPESLSDTLDVAPTALSEHAPEFAGLDRNLQSLRELKRLPEAQFKVHARYAARITGRKLE
ncbi:hypothetical protein H0O03_00085 [Candidatus Micrarchaeota archaeon]|nr:hypothetical protein [Candidatus Micrarchaeota archaeon]